jgi:DMSO/TMAO reductase YedYZ molybdopterin-dependent catalytic subunit
MVKGALGATWFALAHSPVWSRAFAQQDEEILIPFSDNIPPPSREGFRFFDFQQLNSWITPTDQVFAVQHYDRPTLDADRWRLEIDGLVERPATFTIQDIRSRPRHEEVVTIECSGNSGLSGLHGAISAARWGGTPLAPILRECGVKPEGIEVIFWGADSGKETIREKEYTQHFARSISLEDAMQPQHMLVYEMNGEPLPVGNGYPLRLLLPGWYGIAQVKWLTRIEIRDRRFMGRFMGRDYVTIRGEQRGDQVVWMETSVGKANLKSLVARVTRIQTGGKVRHRVYGAAWGDGTPIEKVEIRIDNGVWRPVILDRSQQAPYAWTLWSYDWNGAAPGEHSVVCRATDATGYMQPAMDDPAIAMKHTYWESNGQLTRKITIEG